MVYRSQTVNVWALAFHECNLCLLLCVNNTSNLVSVKFLWHDAIHSVRVWCCFTHSWSQDLFDQMFHMNFISWWETDAISGLFGGPEQDFPWCWALFVGSLKTCLINVKQLTNITTLRRKNHLDHNLRKKETALQTTEDKHVR